MAANDGKSVSETTCFQVQASLAGTTYSFACRADQTVLAAAEAAGVPLPSSCCSGVCTTCAAKQPIRPPSNPAAAQAAIAPIRVRPCSILFCH